MALAGIHEDNLNAWFREHIAAAEPPLEIELITGGHSNLTFRVTDTAGRRFVLRRPPTGAVIATAHDVAREHRIISALADTPVPVPPALGLCEDDAVNDAPFYIMAFVDGVVLENRAVTEQHVPESERGALSDQVIEVLVALHAVVPEDVGLGELGRKEAYVARQLRRWKTQWEKTKTRELPAMDEVHAALEARMPEQVGATIVHGDYRLGNMLVNGPRIAAVLDWELCTLGDPLADLGYLLNYWMQAGDGPAAGGSVTGLPGFATREALVKSYEQKTGRDASGIDYYRALQHWRLAAIVEGVLARYLKGVMGRSANTDGFRLQVEHLARQALAMLETLP